MRESVLVPLGLVMALAGVPAWADQVAPTGGETNPLGTLRWLPDNANEKTQVDRKSVV